MPLNEQAGEQEETGQGAVSLERAIAAVQKRIKLVVALPVLASVLVALLVWFLPNRYDASAVIQIDPRYKSITHIDSVVSDLKGDQPTIESEVEIVKSRPITLQVIDRLGLRQDPEFNVVPLPQRILRFFGFAKKDAGPAGVRAPSKPRDQIADILNLDEPGQSKPERDEIAVAFDDKLKVIRVRNTLLIDIRFSATDAVKAARIANTIAETYIKDQLDSKSRAAATASALLEQKIEEMRGKLTEAELKVEQWKSEHQVFSRGEFVLSEQHLSRLLEQSVIARNTSAEAKAKYEQAQNLARSGNSGAAINDVLQSNTIRLLREQLATVTRKSAELKTKYGPKHPEILKIEAERSEAQAQLNGEIERLVSNLKNEWQVAEGRERQLTQSLAQLKNQQSSSNDQSVELKNLEREAETTKQLFEALLTRYKQTAETQGFQLPDVRIIEKADAPLFPASPHRKQLVILAAIGSLILAVGLAVLLEIMAPGISRADDVARVLQSHCLSSVPSTSDQDPGLLPNKAIRLIVAEPASAYADAIRSARREIDARRKPGEPRIILVTSAMPGEGADLIASNLAHHYAMTGNRPLLIDGDARLMPVTKSLAVARSAGLFTSVTQNAPINPAILRDGVTGLNFLPAAGQDPIRASVPEAISSAAMAEALAGLKTQFDTIVLFAPPLLPVLDARIFADYADQIVFVMAWEKTPKAIAKKALALLGPNRDKLTGVVLNDAGSEDQTGPDRLMNPFHSRTHWPERAA